MTASGLFIRQIQVGMMANFSYLIGDRESGEALVVDPAWEAETILGAAAEEGVKISGVILTHNHYDHINALEDLLKTAKVPVYIHEADAHSCEIGADVFTGLKADAEVPCGKRKVRLVHTPGHTKGSACYLAGGHLITGDTLFVGACGRCDLAGGSAEEMYKSLHERLSFLPDETVVYPGHDYGGSPVSTMGRERRENPYFLYHSLEEFLGARM